MVSGPENIICPIPKFCVSKNVRWSAYLVFGQVHNRGNFLPWGIEQPLHITERHHFSPHTHSHHILPAHGLNIEKMALRKTIYCGPIAWDLMAKCFNGAF